MPLSLVRALSISALTLFDRYNTKLNPDTGVVTVVYPEWDEEKLDWTADEETLPHMPRRYASSDSVSQVTFSVKWGDKPTGRRMLSEARFDDGRIRTVDYEQSFKLNMVIVLTVINTLVVASMAVAFVAWYSSQKAHYAPIKNGDGQVTEA